MVKCSCGARFQTACHHAAHKMNMAKSGSPEEHQSVCSRCGKRFKKYPIPKDFGGKVIFDNYNNITAVICEGCVQ